MEDFSAVPVRECTAASLPRYLSARLARRHFLPQAHAGEKSRFFGAAPIKASQDACFFSIPYFATPRRRITCYSSSVACCLRPRTLAEVPPHCVCVLQATIDSFDGVDAQMILAATSSISSTAIRRSLLALQGARDASSIHSRMLLLLSQACADAGRSARFSWTTSMRRRVAMFDRRAFRDGAGSCRDEQGVTSNGPVNAGLCSMMCSGLWEVLFETGLEPLMGVR